jgi:hypothetical protein
MSEVKLTATSYQTAVLLDSPWAAVFREDLEVARSVFFIGYSISDLDVRRVLFEQKSLTDKCFFIVGDQPSPGTLSRANRFGSVLQEGTDEIAKHFTRKTQSYTPPIETAPLDYCVQRYEVAHPSSTLPDRFVFDLLLFGQIKPEFVWKGLHGGEKYSLPRQVAQTVLKHLDLDKQAAVVHSDLGNGKTLLLEEIKARAVEKDYSIFTLAKHGQSLYEEIESALKQAKKALFIVDNYPDWMEALKFMQTTVPPSRDWF